MKEPGTNGRCANLNKPDAVAQKAAACLACKRQGAQGILDFGRKAETWLHSKPSEMVKTPKRLGGNSMDYRHIVGAALAVPFLFAGLAAAQESGPYKVLKIQMTGGDGGFDYVTADSDGRNLYVARSGQRGHIGVFNLDTLAQVGDIPGTSAHGGAVDTATGHGFATSKPVTMFDAKTFAIMKKIDVQGNPDGYLNDAYNHRFYVLSHSAPNITVLDDKDGSILGTIDIGGAPEQAVTDGHGKIYVDIEDKAAIAVIDANAMKMVGKYDVSSKGGGCAGLALDAKNGILFAACRDKKNMIILSAADGHIITDLPIGNGCDGATFNPETMEAFSSQGDGTMTVIKEARRRVFRWNRRFPHRRVPRF